MLRARLLETLGVRIPVWQLPMAGVSTPALAAAVARAGGLGGLPFGAVNEPEKMGQALAEFAAAAPLCSQNVNVNFFLHHELEGKEQYGEGQPQAEAVEAWRRDMETAAEAAGVAGSPAHLATATSPVRATNLLFSLLWHQHGLKGDILSVLSKHAPKVVSFHFGCPDEEMVRELHKIGSLVFVTATTPEEALYCASRGVDGLVLQGDEAGGHRGEFLASPDSSSYLSTYALFVSARRAVKDYDVHLIPAGGIDSPAAARFFLDLGASAVQIGTAYLGCREASVKPRIRASACLVTPLPTQITPHISGKPARCLATPFVRATGGSLLHYLHRYTLYKRWVGAQPDAELGFYLVGQNYASTEWDTDAASVTSAWGTALAG